MKSTHQRLRNAMAPLVVSLGLLGGSAAHAEAINGAIYTSTSDGTAVNANLYDSKADVYLNGGPNNYPGCHGGNLDAGDYYFQVTDPSGAVLLSSDGIDARKFRVAGGVITQNLGTHADNPPAANSCGSLAIQLLPYADTPNNGGVYKLWITRVSDFHTACDQILPGSDCGLDGFVGGSIKTDNFKVKRPDLPPPPPQGTVEAVKFYDANANGQMDNGEPLLAGWEMTLASISKMVDSTHFTGADGTTSWYNLMPGTDYTVLEGTPMQGNWVHSATIYLGHDGSPINPAGPLNVVAGQTTMVAFGNYCTIPSNGRTLGFWSNKNGQKLFGADDLALMVSLNLRNANGSNFNPASYTAFRTWILSATATNMAYMLSAQLATMELNVHNGFVNGNAIYVPYGGTINSLMADANASLGLYGLTPSGNAQRAYQEMLKNYLDQLNNGAGVLSATPCPASFN